MHASKTFWKEVNKCPFFLIEEQNICDFDSPFGQSP